MKKLKLLPSVLMLVACVALLGVGVFAVAPTQNTISGSITINSANPEVLISAYKYDENGEMEDAPFFTQTPARSGIDINLGSLNFDTSSCNTEEDLKNLDIKITIRVENPTNTKLGVYFSNQIVNGNATSENISVEKELKDSTTSTQNVKATMDTYKVLPAKETNNGVVDTTITFKLLHFINSDSGATVNLKDQDNLLYLNIEQPREYNVILNASYAGAVVSGQYGWNYCEDSPDDCEKTIGFGDSYGILPTAGGHWEEFAGWYTEMNGAGKKINDNDIKLDTYTTLYAYFFTPVSVTLNPVGGTFDANDNIPANNTIKITSANELIDIVPTKTGYVFMGWAEGMFYYEGYSDYVEYQTYVYENKLYYFGEETPTLVQEGHTLDEEISTYIAIWGKTENDIILSLTIDGGDVYNSLDGIDPYYDAHCCLTPGEPYGIIYQAEVSMSGLVLDFHVDPSDIVSQTENFRLEINAVPYVYTWEFNCNGGTYNGSSTYKHTFTCVNGDTDESDQGLFDSIVPTRSGYTFAGWVDQDGYNWTEDESSRVNWLIGKEIGDLILTAQWTAN